MRSSFIALLFGATSVFAQDSVPSSMGEKFGSLNELNTGYRGGLNAIQSSTYTKTKWPWGTLPENCYKTAKDGGYCNPYDVEVYTIKYSECSEPHVMCRCNNAAMSIDQLATQFGRVPVKARQWVNYVSAYEKGPGCGGFSDGDYLTILGDCKDNQAVFFHEVAHSLDGWAVGAKNGSPYSYTQEWKNTVLKGTCVADNYAKRNWGENWCQVAVMSAYHANVQSIWALHVDCMADQMGKSIEQLVANPIFARVAGQTCNRWWPKDKSVCMGDAAKNSGACNGVNSTRKRESGASYAEKFAALAPEIQAQIKEDVAARIAAAEEAVGFKKGAEKSEKRFVA